MKKLTEQNAARYTFILILATFIIRVLIAAFTGLGIGESYYFRGALTIDLSYFDQPPLFFWLSWLSIKIFGLSTFALRFPAVLLFAGTSWFLFLLSRLLFNAKAGFWAVALMNLSAVFTVAIACWFQPDAPLMFFWMAAAYYIARVMRIHQNEAASRNAMVSWLLIGVLMGLATLSKYHVLFLFAGVFLFVVLNPSQRHWLRHPGPYLAVLITIIIAFPVFWWNYENNWVSFVFQGSRAGDGGKFQLHPEWFLRSIGGQALWLLPWIWVPMVREFIQSFKNRNNSQSYSFVFWTAVLPIVFFTVVTLWSDLQYHFHWQAPGYMMLFMPLGYAVDQRLNRDPERAAGTRRWLRFSSLFTVIVITVLSMHMVTGFWQTYGPRWVVKQFGDTDDPTIQGIDYDDIGKRFEKEGWYNNPRLFVGAPRWWLAGKVDWALRGRKDIVVFNNDPRNLAFLVDPNKLKGFDCIVIGQRHYENVKNDVTPFFDSVKQLPDIVIMRNGRDELHLQVYYCNDFHVPAQPREDLPLYKQLTGRPPFGK